MGSKLEMKDSKSKQSLKETSLDLKKSASGNSAKERSASQTGTGLSKQNIATTEQEGITQLREPDLKTKILNGNIYRF